MSTTPPLKPCPFCGGAPRTIERPDNIDGTEFFFAVSCYCGGYVSCAHKMAVRKNAEEAKSAAIEAWNSRTASAQPQATTPEQIDTHLDAVLRAAGSGLRHYTMQKSLDDMRAAMRKAITGDPT